MTTQTRTHKVSQRRYSPSAQANNYGVPPNLFWANTLIAGMALVGSIVVGFIAVQEIRERKQIEVQLMYTNALLIREGLVRPGDMVFGPEGNLEFDGRKFKPKPKQEK